MTLRIRVLVAASTAATCLALPSTAQTLGCTTGGAGGAFPTSGTGGGGVYPGTLPPAGAMFTTTLNVASTPAGATCVTEVKLLGMTHTYTGDCQFVLEDPSGGKHNLIVRPGGGCDYNGDYIVTGVGGSTGFPTSCTGADLAPGTYNQYFGTWPSGTNGIDNADLYTIAPATGDWKVTIIDWAGGDVGFVTSWDICFGTPPPPPTPVCLPTFGGSGAIPTSGTGDGTWDTVQPSAPMIVPLAVTAPAGATKVVDLRLNGLSHTWIGDLQITLTDPSGIEHNIVCRPGLTPPCCGFNCDMAGDYVIRESVGADFSTQCIAGDYMQHFGLWTDGNFGIMNTLLESIPALTGTYTLKIYDWAGGDTGTIDSWEFCFDTPTGPTAYCDPLGPTSDGCMPTAVAPVQPNTTHTSGCTIAFENLPDNRSGIVFYSANGSQNSSWCGPMTGNSALCVIGPTWRTGLQDTLGTAGACDGELLLDWDAYQLGTPGAQGQPWSAGDQAWVQGWFRSPADCRTTFLTNALELTYQ